MYSKHLVAMETPHTTHHVQETQQVLGHDEVMLRKTLDDVFAPGRAEAALHVCTQARNVLLFGLKAFWLQIKSSAHSPSSSWTWL